MSHIKSPSSLPPSTSISSLLLWSQSSPPPPPSSSSSSHYSILSFVTTILTSCKLILSSDRPSYSNYHSTRRNSIVPIVMGARPEDYQRGSPPGSYIHVDDFEAPEQLATFLHMLDNNDTLYNSYFRWKGTGEFINTKFWCRLCAMVHYAQQYPIWYSDPHRWWHGPGICIAPDKGQRWSSWRGKNIHETHSDTVKYDIPFT